MGSYSPLKLLILAVLLFEFWDVSTARSFDFYYFVQQWPGSYCGTRKGCCYPLTGKPASDFSIHGLWPNFKSGKWPQFCNPSDEFDYSQISDLVGELNSYWGLLSCPSSDGHTFWGHEWEKHGTCSLNLTQHDYFQNALSLRTKIDILNALKSADEPFVGASVGYFSVLFLLAGRALTVLLSPPMVVYSPRVFPVYVYDAHADSAKNVSAALLLLFGIALATMGWGVVASLEIYPPFAGAAVSAITLVVAYGFAVSRPCLTMKMTEDALNFLSKETVVQAIARSSTKNLSDEE